MGNIIFPRNCFDGEGWMKRGSCRERGDWKGKGDVEKRVGVSLEGRGELGMDEFGLEEDGEG